MALKVAVHLLRRQQALRTQIDQFTRGSTQKKPAEWPAMSARTDLSSAQSREQSPASRER
jgi:hypothetical protein